MIGELNILIGKCTRLGCWKAGFNVEYRRAGAENHGVCPHELLFIHNISF